MNREYHKWFSPAMGREMELLVFGHAGPRLLVFPSRKRRFYEYEDYGMIHSLRHRLEAGELQTVCVDGIDEQSLYCFEIEPAQRIERHLQFERYVIEEVLREDDAFFPNNEALSGALAAKKIPHELHVWCGAAHRFRYWRQMARVYL